MGSMGWSGAVTSTFHYLNIRYFMANFQVKSSRSKLPFRPVGSTADCAATFLRNRWGARLDPRTVPRRR